MSQVKQEGNILSYERVFDAPRELVWEVFTKPEHVRNWYGPRGMTLSVCEIDFRIGGSYRYVMKSEHGEFGFHGEYKEIVTLEKIVNTWVFEPMPDKETVETMVLTEENGKTKASMHSVFQSEDDLKGWAASGGEAGMLETYERLEELLAKLQA